MVHEPVRISIYHANQCDPKKCTGLRLSRRGLARIVKHTKFLPKRAVVLNPFSEIAFSPADKDRVCDFGLVALDCSWEHAEKVLMGHVKGTCRCLPVLIAGNPVNFGKPTKLTTAEAIAAALYIAGCVEQATNLLSIFSWGHTFMDLNRERLDRYAAARDSSEIVELQKVLFAKNQKQTTSEIDFEQ
jgi:pre-rRNA-processing protein TSR3